MASRPVGVLASKEDAIGRVLALLAGCRLRERAAAGETRGVGCERAFGAVWALPARPRSMAALLDAPECSRRSPFDCSLAPRSTHFSLAQKTWSSTGALPTTPPISLQTMAFWSHRLGHPCTAAAAFPLGDSLLVAAATAEHGVTILQRRAGSGKLEALEAELEGHDAPVSGLYFAATGGADGAGPSECCRAACSLCSLACRRCVTPTLNDRRPRPHAPRSAAPGECQPRPQLSCVHAAAGDSRRQQRRRCRQRHVAEAAAASPAAGEAAAVAA